MPHLQALSVGDVLHIPGTGPHHDRDRGHYHVLLADRDGERVVLLVPISGWHEKCDKTCIIAEGELDCLYKESFVLYAKMNYYRLDHLEARIASGAIEVLDPASDSLTKKITDGVLTSSFAAPTYKKCVARYRERLEEQAAETTEINAAGAANAPSIAARRGA